MSRLGLSELNERSPDGLISDRQSADGAMRSGLAYLTSVQSDDGEFPVFCAHSLDMTLYRSLDRCFFGTALIANVLATCPAASAICERACDFIEANCRPGGVWSYHKKRHRLMYPPPDVDDTALAMTAVAARGRKAPPHSRALLLANRDRHGMFLTWMMPRRGGSNLLFLKKGWRHLLHLPRYRAFFRHALWRVDDVDAGVNANVLTALAPFEGDQRVIEQLLRILREERESSCDKYYDNPALIRYFFSRALAGCRPEARELLVEPAEAGPSASPLDLALTILVRSMWKAPVSTDLVQRLVAAQGPDGAWAIAPVYCTGRRRLGFLHFAAADADRPRLGSEAITTAFCVSALHALA